MYVKDFIEFLQSLPPDAVVSMLTPEEYSEVGGGVYYTELKELTLVGEDTQIEYSEEVANGDVKEFGTVNYFFDKGIPEGAEEDEEDMEMSANAEQVFTPEIIDAIINETRIKNAIELMGKTDPPAIESIAVEVKPNPNSCEEDA